MARTIDNLGIDTSNRYAEDRANYDETLIRESIHIPAQTRVVTTAPQYASEFDALFDLDERGKSWAAFYAPPNFFATRRRLFAEQVIPQLGSSEKRDAQARRLKAYGNQEQEGHPQESDVIGKEKETLLSLLNKLGDVDQLLFDINSRRVQYQKG